MPCDSRAVIRVRQDAYAYDVLTANPAISEIVRDWIAEQTGQEVVNYGNLAFMVGTGVWASLLTIHPDHIETSERLTAGGAGHSRPLSVANLESFLSELSFMATVYAESEVISDVADNAGYRTLTIRA